ncbi:MAG: TIGR03943 family protein [Syntrophomonas sp.]
MKAIHIIRAAIFFGFGYFILQLLGSGDIDKYIHPRFDPGLQLSCWVFFILGLVQIGQLFGMPHHHQHTNLKREVLACALLAFPLIFGFFDSTDVLGSYMIEKKENNPARAMPVSSSPPAKQASWEAVIDDNRFLATMIILYSNPADYVNKEIEFTGFVYHQDDFPSDCFLAARFGITCCAADAQVTGLLCHFQKQQDLPQDQWIRVKGVLQSQPFMSQEVPVVEVSSLQFIDPPENPYVY